MECACKRSPARTFTLALIVMITANGGAGGGSGGVGGWLGWREVEGTVMA